jgi:hypothetical protein
MEKQLSVASGQLPVPTLSPKQGDKGGHPHASSSKIDFKSLFHSTLTASCRESILCMGPFKVFKTGNLWMEITTMQSILCMQSIDTKYFT